jgi:proteasome alpha subunit
MEEIEMQQMPGQHQIMGYDRAITMFSPDGRLLLVEYAKKTVRQGSTAVGVKCKDGVLLVTDKRIIDKLIIPESVEKIFKIDDHVMTTAAGIVSDARVLVDRAQLKAQQHKVTYDSPIDVLTIVKDICTLKQLCTQSGGLRPFGVSMLVTGADETGTKLYQTDPTGIFFEFKANAIGEFESEMIETLHKEYKESMFIEDALKMVTKALAKLIGKEFNADRLDAAYIKEKDKKIVNLSAEQLKKYLK